MTDQPAHPLEGLIEKWRAQAADDYVEAPTLRECADELEAALAVPPPQTWQPIATALREPYYVEADGDSHCNTCGQGRVTHWTVVGPDGCAQSTSWEDREYAEEIADILNVAYGLGQQHAREEAGR